MKDADYELKFTRNVVCVDVTGPGEGNLSEIGKSLDVTARVLPLLYND